MVACPEDPQELLGLPIGQYHCPHCGCMQIAGLKHMCDPEDCLLEDCDCLPPGEHESPNLTAWKLSHDDANDQEGSTPQPHATDEPAGEHDA